MSRASACVAASLAVLLAAGAAEAQSPPPSAPTTFVFEETATLAPAQVLGETPAGRRQSVPILGGVVAGPALSGRILPGGADYQLVRTDGSVAIDADYMIETDDHVIIHVRNVGVIVPPTKERPQAYFWAAPTLDAPNGRYGWLNDAIFVSRVSPAGDKDHPAVKVTVYKVG